MRRLYRGYKARLVFSLRARRERRAKIGRMQLAERGRRFPARETPFFQQKALGRSRNRTRTPRPSVRHPSLSSPPSRVWLLLPCVTSLSLSLFLSLPAVSFPRSPPGSVFGVGIYSAEKPQGFGESCSAGWKLATEPMNRFFQRRPEGHSLPILRPFFPSTLSPTRIVARKHVETISQLKALIAVFTVFLFERKELLLPCAL